MTGGVGVEAVNHKSLLSCSAKAFGKDPTHRNVTRLVLEATLGVEEYGESDDITKSPLYPKGNEEKTFKIKVLFGKEERLIDAKATDTVVVSFEKAGVASDSHCRSGACGFCRSLLLEGEVWQRPQSDGVRAADKDMGYFHPCSAYPMSDLTIQVFSRL